MRTSVGTRFMLGVGGVTALTIGVAAFVILRAQEQRVVSQLQRSADLLSDTIESSTRITMLQNRREDLHHQIETIGRAAGIERVRIFNKEGQVMFSSDREEIGLVVDKHAEACDACHAEGRPLERLPRGARSRIFRDRDGRRVLGIVNPIDNEPSCWQASCHAHSADTSVLGVLDVTVTLAEADRMLASSRRMVAGLAVLAIAATSGLLWWLHRWLILRPVQALLEGTRRLGEGNLAVTIPVTGSHELGDLARAFNEMTRRLAEAQRLLTQADKLAAVGRLAAGVAHEINNPLTGVLTYASFLAKRVRDDPELARDLEVIVRETKRCREIVRGLLDFARQTPPVREPMDLNEVVRRAVAVVMNQLTLHRIALQLDLASDLAAVRADANQMQQVVVNLLLNAADAASEGGGNVRVVTRCSELAPRGHVPIRVARCPSGCDLLDPAVRIGGLASIRVLRHGDGREAPVNLDPVYGRHTHVVAVTCEAGTVARWSCPRCRSPLEVAGRRCPECGAPVFGVAVEGEERVLWCARVGCGWSWWEAEERAGPRPVLELIVEDDGPGIPAEHLPHLFEPFFTTKGRRGTGLGLAVTWAIVERHGGTIEVASEPGRGARFTVRLPLEARGAPAAAVPEPDAVGG